MRLAGITDTFLKEVSYMMEEFEKNQYCQILLSDLLVRLNKFPAKGGISPSPSREGENSRGRSVSKSMVLYDFCGI